MKAGKTAADYRQSPLAGATKIVQGTPTGAPAPDAIAHSEYPKHVKNQHGQVMTAHSADHEAAIAGAPVSPEAPPAAASEGEPNAVA